MAFKMDLGPRSLVIRFRRTRGNIGLNTNDPDGKKSNKRKRKAAQDDEEDLDEGAPDFDSEQASNPYSLDRMTTPSLSSPQSADTFLEYPNVDSVDADSVAGVVRPVQVKNEPVSDLNGPDLATTSAGGTPLPPIAIATVIKQENDTEFSDDDYFDGNIFSIHQPINLNNSLMCIYRLAGRQR